MGPRNRHSALPRGIHFAQNREGLSCKRKIVSDRCAAFFHRLGPALRERPRWLASRSSRRRSRRRPRDFFPFHRALRSAQAGHRSANDPALRHGLTRILETKIPSSDTNPAPAVFQTSHQSPVTSHLPISAAGSSTAPLAAGYPNSAPLFHLPQKRTHSPMDPPAARAPFLPAPAPASSSAAFRSAAHMFRSVGQ